MRGCAPPAETSHRRGARGLARAGTEGPARVPRHWRGATHSAIVRRTTPTPSNPKRRPEMPPPRTSLDSTTIRLDADPEYARQAQKLRDLQAHAAALEARRGALREGLGRDV